jgi:catechol 2,3-dioxygenase-like lactoylglutathione lyase family enzyme
MHCAFRADSVDAVRAFHAKALELGAESLHEPRLWPEYHPGYYGAFVRDPDGNNVEAVFHRAAPDA